MKRLALLAALLACWAAPALATPVVTNIGSLTQSTAATTFVVPTTADSALGNSTIVAFVDGAASGTPSCSDSAGNTYLKTAAVTWNTNNKLLLCYAVNTVDLPAPCTLTAVTYPTTTSLVVTSGGTCAAASAFTSTMSVAGAGLTAGTTLNGNCTLVSGAATCAIAGNAATCASACGTATVASTITIDQGASGRTAVAFITVSGLASSSILDQTGTANTGTGTAPSSAPTVTVSNELVIYALGLVNTPGTYTQATNFTGLTNGTDDALQNLRWGYDIVTTSASPAANPSWITSRVFGIQIWSFNESAAGGGASHNLSLLGVGN